MRKKNIIVVFLVALIIYVCFGNRILVMIKENGIYRSRAFDIAKNIGQGINIGNALESYTGYTYEDITDYETAWYNPVITQELFILIRGAGFDSVRLPVTWDRHLNEDGTIDSEWLNRVKQVIDYAYSQELYVIINVHHDEWYSTEYSNLQNVLTMTESIWSQIATYFKEYDEHLIFEGFNEPRMMGYSSDIEYGNGTDEANDVINKMNTKFIETVRKTGGNNKDRCLMIAAYCAGCDISVLESLELPQDSNLIISCHCYEPYEFCQNYYDLAEWSADEEENTRSLDYKLYCLYEYSNQNNIPVVITEFGAVDKNNDVAREAYCQYFVDKVQDYGISYIWWDNNCFEDTTGLYGIIDRAKIEIRFKNIVDILTKEN